MSPQKAYQAYNQAFVTASKTRQIVMLYDGAIRFISQAKEAIEENRIEDRFNLLTKSSEVIMGLQSCLDFENGDEVARVLYDFYSDVDSKIMSIQRNNDKAECESLIDELKEMRIIWSDIDTKGDSKEQESVNNNSSHDSDDNSQLSEDDNQNKTDDYLQYSGNITA